MVELWARGTNFRQVMDVHIFLSIVFPSSICSTLQLCALRGSFNIWETFKILHRSLRLLRPLAQSHSFTPPTTLRCEQQPLLLSNGRPAHLLFDMPSRWFCVYCCWRGTKEESIYQIGIPQGHVLSPPFVYSLHKLLYQSIDCSHMILLYLHIDLSLLSRCTITCFYFLCYHGNLAPTGSDAVMYALFIFEIKYYHYKNVFI